MMVRQVMQKPLQENAWAARTRLRIAYVGRVRQSQRHAELRGIVAIDLKPSPLRMRDQIVSSGLGGGISDLQDSFDDGSGENRVGGAAAIVRQCDFAVLNFGPNLSA